MEVREHFFIFLFFLNASLVIHLKKSECWSRCNSLLICPFSFCLFLSLPLSVLGCLRRKMQNWLLGCGKKCCSTETKFMKSLIEFPKRFVTHNHSSDASVTYDDEELVAWECEAKRWARVVFLAVKEEHHLTSILTVYFSYFLYNEWIYFKIDF